MINTHNDNGCSLQIVERVDIMGIFDKLREPVVLKENDDMKRAWQQLDNLCKIAPKELQDQIEYDKKILYYGIKGEENLMFELKNSHIPMYILHDVRFEENGLKTQIDYIVITRKLILILECKNLYGNISIDSQGNFTRTIQYGKKYYKEGIYSPITQNQRHLDMIREKRRKSKGVLGKIFFDRFFENNYKSIVVLANSKSVLDIRYAPKEIKAQIVKVDGMVNYIKKLNSNSSNEPMTDKEMKEIAEFFLSNSVPNSTDFTSKYQLAINNLQCMKAVTDDVNLNDNDSAELNGTAVISEDKSMIESGDTSDTSCGVNTQAINNIDNIEDMQVYKALKDYRYRQSRIENIKAYYIFNNSQLEQLIKENPKSIDELKRIKGFADVKCSKYGEDVLRILKENL
ncbi:MAG: NERD domain-containing protein [Acutalibacteraceae bacterium]|nr:NERD domain-containing protein [Acutalibacteraceae bacterium]